MFLGAKRPPPNIRRVSRPVQQADQRKQGAPGSTNGKPSLNISNPPKKPSDKNSKSLKPSLASRSGPTPSSLAPRQRSRKRKAPSPTTITHQQFSSDSEDDEDDEEAQLHSTKRSRTSPRRDALSPDFQRKTFDLRTWTADDDKAWPIRQGADLTAGEYAKEYRTVFETGADGAFVDLKYPSNCPTERFELVAPIESQGYEAIEDVIQSIEHVCRYYFTASEAEALIDDITGYQRKLKRAVINRSMDTFAAIVKEFNNKITQSLADGTISAALENIHSLPLPLIERITSQIYSRTVSPKVNILKQYENGTDNVYGELLPRFSHTIFSETELRSDHVFVDLGSGVGNVVLQAALEVGCESWGIEQMPNPCALASEQLTEFKARCKRWSISPGEVHLLQGDFLESPEIDGALRRADVVLINNQAFTPDLNNKILLKLLDLKEGCRIVSLRSFVAYNHQIKARNIDDPKNLLRVDRKEYFSGSVSWTDVGGDYFIATKDTSRLKRFHDKSR